MKHRHITYIGVGIVQVWDTTNFKNIGWQLINMFIHAIK